MTDSESFYFSSTFVHGHYSRDLISNLCLYYLTRLTGNQCLEFRIHETWYSDVGSARHKTARTETVATLDNRPRLLKENYWTDTQNAIASFHYGWSLLTEADSTNECICNLVWVLSLLGAYIDDRSEPVCNDIFFRSVRSTLFAQVALQV